METNKIVVAELANGKKYFANLLKNSMAVATAERFLFEMILTDKWDHLFHRAGVKATSESFSYINMDNEEKKSGYVSAFSLNLLPRLMEPNFIIREREWGSTLNPAPKGFQKVKFISSKNISVTVTVKGQGSEWKPFEVEVFFFGQNKPYDSILLTQKLRV